MGVKQIIFRLAQALGLFALCRLATRRRVRILCYHGGCIGDESEFNPKLFCSADLLERRMRWMLAKGFTPVALDDAVSVLASGASPPRLPFVVTFDDGWHSTGRNLLPVLAALDVPATLYLASAAFESGAPVSDVTAGYAMWKAGPRRVEIVGLGEPVDGAWDLGRRDERRRLERAVEAWVGGDGTEAAGRAAKLERFAEAIGVDRTALALGSRRFHYMDADELREAAERGCAVELHGHAHAYPAGDPAAFERDVARCREVIVGMGLPAPRHYCYPSGEHDGEAPAVLERLGVRSATACEPGLVRKDGSFPYFLPRLIDGKTVSDLEFEAEMSGFTDLLRTITGRRTTRT